MKSVLLIFYTAIMVFASEIRWYEMYKSAQEEAIKENKPIMLMYTMQECQACWYMKNIVFIDDEIVNYVNSHFIPIEMDIDEETIEDLKAVGTPTFFFLQPDGSVLEKVPGAANKKVFKEKLEAIVKRYEKRKGSN